MPVERDKKGQATVRALELLLDSAWIRIAASGWNRYQLYGPGALLASMLMLEGKSGEMDYITRNVDAPLPDWLESAINTYDPNTSVVLVFIEDAVFRHATQPAGPQLVGEYGGVLAGPAYCRIASRMPPPRECAVAIAH